MESALSTPIASRPLRRGRHPLTREAISASQKARMLEAVASAVAQKGYPDTAVADVLALSGVSRRTFYELFRDKEDLFLAAYRAGMELLLAGIHADVSRLPRQDWRARVRVGVESYLKILASKPEDAWAYSIEVFGAGRRALAFRAEVLQRWVGQWQALHELARAEDAGIQPVSPLVLLALVGGIEELVRECLRARGASQLPALAPPIVELVFATLTAVPARTGQGPQP